MITEDYVSFETAKLLKEKGFDEPTTKSYYTEGFENPMKFSHDLLPRIQTDEFLCPTLQMVMKWLREAHNLLIVIDKGENFYAWQLEDNESGAYIGEVVGECSSYEEACEEAIKYCLENLV